MGADGLDTVTVSDPEVLAGIVLLGVVAGTRQVGSDPVGT